ncbi:MAG: hypothetical protein GY811_31210 [Myxococcales bacterium]|nr:hypothetical protein [Myxococcales bacterium]
MQKQVAAGIWGVGTYLPPTVRTNDWWPKEVANAWLEKDAKIVPEKSRTRPEPKTEGQRRVLEAMAKYRDDPFYGAVERRVLDEDKSASDMEIKAAAAALADADVDPASIDLVLGFSIVPDYQTSPNACLLHKTLGLPRSCLALATDSSCNSFLHQLSLAESMILSGRAKFVLLFQSNLLRRLIAEDWPASAWFGDAATAIVVGPVSEGHGVLAMSHRVDGTTHDALVASVPGRRWYEEGRVLWHPRDPKPARELILQVADHGNEVVTEALENAEISKADISFYSSHQATPWFRPVTQDFIGLTNARYADTFDFAGHVSSCNIPLALHAGKQEGTLKDGDVVATYSGGSGVTWSSVVMRWGRG